MRRALILIAVLMIPSAAAFHPPWEGVTWWGHADGEVLWADRVIDAAATQPDAMRTADAFVLSQAGSLPGDGSVSWSLPLMRAANETLELSPGGNISIVTFFSASSGEMPGNPDPSVGGGPAPGAGDVEIAARLLVDGEVKADAPAKGVTAGTGWSQASWTLVNPLSRITPGQDVVFEVIAKGPATSYKLGLSEATGWSRVSLPLVVALEAPEGEITRSVAVGWQANLTLHHANATDHIHVVNWTGPARVVFDAAIDAAAGEAVISVRDGAGNEVRRGGSIDATILDGVAGPWSITTIAAQFAGNVSWRVADIDGPPVTPYQPPTAPPPPAADPPASDDGEEDSSQKEAQDLGNDAEDKNASLPGALLLVALAAAARRWR